MIATIRNAVNMMVSLGESFVVAYMLVDKCRVW